MAIENAVTLHGTNFKRIYSQDSVSKQPMPLSMVGAGEKVRVRSIGGKDETRRFLSNLGFVEDAEVSVVSELNGNVIVVVKGARIAISKAMACRVMAV
jgi:ferrous iron transport protein A